MTAKELDNKLAANGKTNSELARWILAQTGEKIHASEICQHRNGKRKMSRFAKATYSLFFKILELQ